MPAISRWSTTAASNDDADADINWAENQAPSTVNDSARNVMAAVRSWYEDAEWRNWGHTVTRTGNTTFTIAADVTAIYKAGRPIRCTDASTLYGKVVSCSYSAPNSTITVELDSGNLSASLTAVALGFIPTTKSVPSTAIRWLKGADVASADPLVVGADGNYFDVTGTTGFSAITTVGIGTVIKLHFDGALTLTHHATDLILPGGASITTAAGDEAEFVEYASGDWRCTSYVKASGRSVIGALTSGTAQASTSGTAIDFTGIPSWVKRVTVNFAGVSTDGADYVLVQLGDSDGIETSGYLGSNNAVNFTNGFSDGMGGAEYVRHGTFVINLVGSNQWVCAVSMGRSDAAPTNTPGGFSKTLSGTLDRVRITTTGGTNAFDAGVINIQYE